MITNRTIRFPAVAVFSLLLLVSLTVTYLMAQHGIFVGLIAAGISIGLLFLVAVVRDYRVGFYAIFLMGIFMFYIDRIVNLSFPVGTVYDALVGLTFFSLFIANKRHDWTLFKNPVTI